MKVRFKLGLGPWCSHMGLGFKITGEFKLGAQILGLMFQLCREEKVLELGERLAQQF